MGGYMRQKKKGNFFLFLAVTIILGGYALFFTSNTWMPEKKAELVTALGKGQSYQNRTFCVERWDYCEEAGVMEVELGVENDAYDGVNTYRYEAADRTGEELTVETVLEERDWIILQIRGLSEDFREVSLRISLPEDEGMDPLRLYTNVNEVNRVEALAVKDRQTYLINRLSREIESCEKTRKKNEKKIGKLQKKNEEIQAEMERLTAELDWQTQSEQEDTQAEITEMEIQISSNEEKAAELTAANEELDQRILLKQKQIETEGGGG